MEILAALERTCGGVAERQRVGADALTDGSAAGRAAIAGLDRVAWPGPFDRAALIRCWTARGRST